MDRFLGGKSIFFLFLFLFLFVFPSLIFNRYLSVQINPLWLSSSYLLSPTFPLPTSQTTCPSHFLRVSLFAMVTLSLLQSSSLLTQFLLSKGRLTAPNNQTILFHNLYTNHHWGETPTIVKIETHHSCSLIRS